LAALLTNLGTPAGTLVMIATPVVGRDQHPVIMQYDSGEPHEGGAALAMLPEGFSGPSGDALVLALSEAVVQADGRMRDLRSMSLLDRQRTETLLDQYE